VDAAAAVVPRTNLESTAERLSAFGHAPEPQTPFPCGVVSVTVVGDLDVDETGGCPDADVSTRSICAAQYVGQRLLDDSIAGAAGRRRYRSILELDIDLDAQAGGAGTVN
jgi:hypothetical protein